MKKIGQGIVKAYEIMESLSNGWCEQCGLYFIASKEEVHSLLPRVKGKLSRGKQHAGIAQ